MNKIINPSANQAQEIVSEINEKIKVYETRMATRLSRWNSIVELYMGRTATHRDNSKNSPNSAELYKAIRAKSNMEMRMILGQKPPFELSPLDQLGYDEPGAREQPGMNRILKAEHYLSNQMELANFNRGCYQAINQLNLYGTVVNHMQYEPLRASFLGQKRYITSYRPISLVNCAFALDCYNLEESSFVALSDVQNKGVLSKLKAHDPEGKMYNLGNISNAMDDKDYKPEINTWVQQRMLCAGYMDNKFDNGIERITYYGTLECRHDNEEYCIEIVNRKHIIRMEAYEGLRPLSVTTINNIGIEPLGAGLGDLFGGHLREIDDSEAALTGMVDFAGKCMFQKVDGGFSDEDTEVTARNFGILNLQSRIESLMPDPRAIQIIDIYRQNKVQTFRNAAGAPDVMQAIIPEDQATATATSLAMNESVRGESVQSELIAPTLLTHYLKVALQNAQKYNTQPFVLNIGGVPMNINPSDLLLDVEVRIKITTDQDFKPTRMKQMVAAAQMMDATPPNGITGKKLDSSYVKLEILKDLDIPNWDKSVSDITQEDMLRANVMAQMQAQPQQGPGMAQGGAQSERAMGERPGRKEQAELNNPNGDTISTPAGPTLTAPGGERETINAIRNSR